MSKLSHLLLLLLLLGLSFQGSLGFALAQGELGELPRKENVGLPEGLPVEQIIKADQEIMAQMQAQKSGGGLLGILMVGGTVLTLTGLGGWYYLRKKGKGAKLQTAKEGVELNPNDQKRKEDLEELQIALSAYFKLEERFPSESEFGRLRERMEKPMQDPKEGQLVPDKEGVSFGYYYDQRRGGGKEIDPQYYRLWCFLENGERLMVTSEDQKETIAEGRVGEEGKEEMGEPAPMPVAPAIPPATAQAVPAPVYYAPSAPAPVPSGWSSLIVPFILIMITLINLGLILINLLLVYQAGQIRSEILKAQQQIELSK